MVGLAREQVAAARAAVAQQPVTCMATLDLGAVGRRRAGHRRRGLLLDPAEGRDVLVRAEQDAGLRRAGLRGEIRLPLGQRVAALDEPAGHVGRVAVAHRPLQHGQSEAVDLEVDDARARPSRRARPIASRSAGSRAACRRRRRSSRRRRRARPRRPTATSATPSADQNESIERSPSVMLSAASSISASRIRMSRRPVTSISGSRSAAMTGGSNALRIAITAAASEGAAEALDCGAGDDPGGDEQRERREEPRDDEPNEPDAAGASGPRPAFSP